MYCDFLGRSGDEVFNQMAKWQNAPAPGGPLPAARPPAAPTIEASAMGELNRRR